MMMQEKNGMKCSVVMATYNGEKRSVESYDLHYDEGIYMMKYNEIMVRK